MDIKGLDVVYTVKNAPHNEELRWSLRSLRNLPGIGKVWIYGGLPNCVNPEAVNYVKVLQNQGNKWDNTALQLIKICENDNITENFIWFNDDFFVMQETDRLEYYKDRTLSQRILDFNKRTPYVSRGKYAMRLRRAEWALNSKQKTTRNFELHIPMVFNREKLLKTIHNFRGQGAKRSLYGNCYIENPIQRDDIKIYELNQKPTKKEDFLSTTDATFRSGEVGKYIRSKFRKASPYEKSS